MEATKETIKVEEKGCNACFAYDKGMDYCGKHLCKSYMVWECWIRDLLS
jgi:hypothetical protein